MVFWIVESLNSEDFTAERVAFGDREAASTYLKNIVEDQHKVFTRYYGEDFEVNEKEHIDGVKTVLFKSEDYFMKIEMELMRIR